MALFSRYIGVFFRTGYQEEQYPLLTAIFNRTLALLLLVAGLPLILLMAAVLKLRDGGPVFYRGVRLGLHKKPFVMYKFRTLPVDAQERIGTRLLSELPEEQRMVTPFTRFLRDTRLDEIPQLFNILKGDMVFIGPRPERPEVYEARCRTIPEYDRRFQVKPGLIGYSQLFTPHSTPKEIRAHIDNRLMLKSRSLFWTLQLIAYTILRMCADIIRKSWHALQQYLDVHLRHRYAANLRLLPRHAHARIRVEVADSSDGPWEAGFAFVDINDRYFRIDGPRGRLAKGRDYAFRLERRFRRGGRPKRKRAVLRGRVEILRESTASPEICGYVVRYTATTPLNQYMLDKYFCEKSMA